MKEMEINVDGINKLRFRVRTETIVNDLLSKGVSYDDIVIRYKSSHKRNWAGDLLHCETKGDKIYLDISRDGLFDALPEYLFMQPLSDSYRNNSEKQKIIAFNKQQKTNANILLNPLEHALFEKRAELERTENQILKQLFTSGFSPLIDFYKIDTSLAPAARIKFARLYPLICSLAGKFPLLTFFLSWLLDADAQYEITEESKKLEMENTGFSGGLGSDACGNDMLLQGGVTETEKTITFFIGPIHFNDLESFLPGGEKRNIFRCFTNYFIPLSYNINIIVDVESADSSFSFDNAYLGYNTTTK